MEGSFATSQSYSDFPRSSNGGKIGVMRKQYIDMMCIWSTLLHDELCAGDQFDWAAWWKFVHADARAVPEEVAGAFMVFHFVGMFGLSEAKAESVGSTLKQFDGEANLPTEQIRDRTLLREAGFRGDGTDDMFILSCWAELFGDEGKFRFQTLRPSKARGRYQAGGGSKTLNRVLGRASAKRRGTRG